VSNLHIFSGYRSRSWNNPLCCPIARINGPNWCIPGGLRHQGAKPAS